MPTLPQLPPNPSPYCCGSGFSDILSRAGFRTTGVLQNEIENSSPEWSLTVKLYDTTPGNDKLKLDYSRLEGEYENITAVPVPSAFLLLSSGLAGIGFLRRRFKKKQESFI
jgi:hypothetical protein